MILRRKALRNQKYYPRRNRRWRRNGCFFEKSQEYAFRIWTDNYFCVLRNKRNYDPEEHRLTLKNFKDKADSHGLHVPYDVQYDYIAEKMAELALDKL